MAGMGYEHLVMVYRLVKGTNGVKDHSVMEGPEWVPLDAVPPKGYRYVSPSPEDILTYGDNGWNTVRRLK